MSRKIVNRSLLFLVGLVSLAAALFFACSGGGGGAVAVPPTTTSFVGTQSPGDFWTWTITKDINGSGSITAENITSGLTYSGSVSRLGGDSAGISSMLITGTTDTRITTPAAAFAIEIPGTALMVATAPTFTFNHSGIVELSGRPPIIAAAQGVCPTTGATVNWIEMPGVGWCPTAGASNPTRTCTTPDPAYGTAEILVSGGTYTINVTYYLLDGTQGALTGATMSCTCSEGVIQCMDMGGRPIRIAFTPSGVFFMDESAHGVAGVVQPDLPIVISDFLTNGKSFKAMWYTAWDDFSGGGCISDSECSAYPGGTCHSGHCGIPETSPMSITADGTTLNGFMYSNIKNGVASSSGGSINFSNVSQPVPGLIRAELVSGCSSTTDVVMAVRKIQNKYVGLLISHSPCPTFDMGFNVLTVEQ